MAINLRSVRGDLHQRLKVRAAEESVTIESLCVRYLWWGLEVPSGEVQAKAVRVRKGAVSDGVAGEFGDQGVSAGRSVSSAAPVPVSGVSAVACGPRPRDVRPSHAANCKCGLCVGKGK